MTVQEHAGNEKSCVWQARDFADGELKHEFFCIRFQSIESKYANFHLFIFFFCIIGKVCLDLFVS